MSFEKTIKKAKRGNKKAFQELIKQEKHKLYRMAYLYVKNENDALDIVQETIYKAYISLKNLNETNHFSSWLTRILINNALDFIRISKRIVPFEEIGDFQKQEKQPVEERMDVMNAIDRLDERYKTVVILRYYNDYTLKQIANVLECPEGTIKTQLHRAIQKLKSDLREEYMR